MCVHSSLVYFSHRMYLQTLNIGIFRAIGHVGVYYGFKLGHKVTCLSYN